MNSIAHVKDTFLYYAYGSNLLKKRIRINNPSAEFLGIGRLDDHQLDFTKYSDHWRGASATIIPREKFHIWGAIWRLHNNDLPALDKQEGVDTNWYFAKTVTVTTPDGQSVECRTYQQTINPPIREEGEEIPPERQPCITYLECIVNGAKECQLPEYYIEELKKIPNNGQVYKDMIDIYKPETFLYFAYGSNLLTVSIKMHSPSADFVSIGRFDNHRLHFIKYCKFWGGPTATLVPTANAHIWGVIWRLNKDDMTALDAQNEIEIKKYYIKYITINTPHMGNVICRSYIQRINPLPRGDNDPIPAEQWPSWTYKQAIITGAKEHGLPPYYIRELRKLKDNGEEAYLRTECLLSRYAKNKPCECRVPGRIPRKPLKLDLVKIKSNKQNVEDKNDVEK